MSTPSVFIVEDEAIIAEDLRHRVEAMGYQVSGTAASGTDACSQVANLQPNVVLMDIVLRGEPSGIEAAREIRRLHDIPVVFLTSHSDSHTITAASSTEPLGYLLKPIDSNELRVTLQIALSRHSAEQKLRQAEHRLASMLRCLGDGLIATDRNGLVTYVNSRAEEICGWRDEEMLGRPFSELIRLRKGFGGEPLPDPVTEAATRGMVVHLERGTVLVRRDGSEVYIDDSAAPIIDASGQLLGVVVIFRDGTMRMQAETRVIDEKRRLEAEMDARRAQLQRLTTHFSQFSGEIFGDLRLALASVRRTSQSLIHALRDKPDAEAFRLASDMLEQADQIYVAFGLFAAALESSSSKFRSVL